MGYIGNKVTGVREPIALVVDERTTTTDGLAVALKQTASCKWSDDKTTVANSQTFTTLDAALADMDGYHYTYDPSGSADNIAKANVAVNGGKYAAFYQAIHYNAGIPLTFSGGRRGKWFLPTLGQLHHLLEKFGGVNIMFKDMGSQLGYGSYRHTVIDNAFSSAGSNLFNDCWVSTEYSNEKAIYFASRDMVPPDREELYYEGYRKDYTIPVRPFIHY